MSYFDEIKRDLPNIPDEPIGTWLAPMADAGYGWPPDPVGLGKWRYVLVGKSLDYWRKTKWDLKQLPLSQADIQPLSWVSVDGIIAAHVKGQINAFSGIVDGKERFVNLGRYMCTHGTMPVPPILLESPDGLKIIDGNHRLAALHYLRLEWATPESKKKLDEAGAVEFATTHDAWIVSPPAKGEYDPDPVTEQQDREFEEWENSLKKRTFTLPGTPKGNE